MEEMKLVFQQEFHVDNKNIIGKIEKDQDNFYIAIYENNKEIKRKLYNGSLDDYSMIAEMENFI